MVFGGTFLRSSSEVLSPEQTESPQAGWSDDSALCKGKGAHANDFGSIEVEETDGEDWDWNVVSPSPFVDGKVDSKTREKDPAVEIDPDEEYTMVQDTPDFRLTEEVSGDVTEVVDTTSKEVEHRSNDPNYRTEDDKRSETSSAQVSGTQETQIVQPEASQTYDLESGNVGNLSPDPCPTIDMHSDSLVAVEKDADSYLCLKCEIPIFITSDIISSNYQAMTGPGYLTKAANNVNILQEIETAQYTTGRYTIQEVSCGHCAAILGVTYAGAADARNQYKVGKFLVGRDRLLLPPGVSHPKDKAK